MSYLSNISFDMVNFLFVLDKSITEKSENKRQSS